MIPNECKRILDVGCGDGSCWKDFKGEVFGIEINEEAAKKAERHLKFVVSGDVEKTELPFQAGFFDCLIFADVLEHLYDPWGLLLKFKKLVGPKGYILISVPNIRHYRILRSLIFKGKFSYEQSGILDIDHVRFFTQKEIFEMLSSTGFKPVTVKKNISASPKHKLLNGLLMGALDDFLTEQYYVLAQLI